MVKRRRIIIAVLLLLSIGNYSRLAGNENIRAIQFISIFTIGLLSGLLLNEFVTLFKGKENNSGINGKPVAIGNFTHFLTGVLGLIKPPLNITTGIALRACAVMYLIFTVLFGYVLFTNPGK